MYKIKETTKYKKDLLKLRKRRINLNELRKLLTGLQNKDFTHAYKNHKLNPKTENVWECHIGSVSSDWVLVYKYEEDQLILLLIRTGLHSDIFEDIE